MATPALQHARVRPATRRPWAADALRLIPGIALAAGVMLITLPLADQLGRIVLDLQGVAPGAKTSPVSGGSIAILLGLLVRNVFGLPAWLQPGVQFSVTRLLRLGIIFVGIKLTFIDMLKLGAWGVPIVATTMALLLGSPVRL